MDPEAAHHRTMKALNGALASGRVRRLIQKRTTISDPRLQTTLWDIDFPNPLGMAAGFDKDGRYFNALGALGFGHVEVGTVTGQPQEGNPRPRLFRLVEDEALLNRMGFNNQGSAALAGRLQQGPIEPILGINLGKSKVVPLEDAVDDYGASLKRLHRYARYIVINVSSPNTPGLRRLQGKAMLQDLLGQLQELNMRLGISTGMGRKPLLVKISPDLSSGALEDVLSVVEEESLDGIIATNTTISREDLESPGVDELGAGGISGRPLTRRSCEMVAQIYERVQKTIPIIGVGGVFDAADAWAMLEAGASMVQIWTGFVYGGPLIVRDILSGILEKMEERGFHSISEVVGTGRDRVINSEMSVDSP